MRTSRMQYIILVEFMERNGDLSKPSGGPRGRHYIQEKWKDLTKLLNSEGSGDSRSEEKWRKVWSDLKNNTKRKLAKINRAAIGTGGGPALQLSLTDLENRVMQIIGVQAATGMMIPEAGFQQDELEIPPIDGITYHEEAINAEVSQETINTHEEPGRDWPMPGCSQSLEQLGADMEQSPVTEETWKPPPKKKKKNNDEIASLFVESDRLAREQARERATAIDHLETERLRLEGERLRLEGERIRQRDMELQIQQQWMEFLREALGVITRMFGGDTG